MVGWSVGWLAGWLFLFCSAKGLRRTSGCCFPFAARQGLVPDGKTNRRTALEVGPRTVPLSQCFHASYRYRLPYFYHGWFPLVTYYSGETPGSTGCDFPCFNQAPNEDVSPETTRKDQEVAKPGSPQAFRRRRCRSRPAMQPGACGSSPFHTK